MTVLLQTVDGSQFELAMPEDAELCFSSFKALVVERLGVSAYGKDVAILSDSSQLADDVDWQGAGVGDGAVLTVIQAELEVGASVFYRGGAERISGRRLVHGERGTVAQTRRKGVESTEILVQLLARRNQAAWFPAEAFCVCSRSAKTPSFEKLLEMSYTVADLKEVGYSAPQFKDAGYSLTQMKEGGFLARDMRRCGYTLQQIRDAGYSWDQCKEASYTAADLKRVDWSRLLRRHM
eukprot:TRINITY_DN1578_c0_g4_i1.p1 TRINITY_DN1578_c0_g4~~TRINITY_DN1578_c0_g4_i1.p1  ORF type:complete len:259 (+),score=26.58 TRINITY_DN1578_c0_g4_i1:67-777(+)